MKRPLAVYVHLPWCVSKCPYCDFNSHALRGRLPAAKYVSALIRELEQELPLVWGRTVHSIFFGGGTPSLFGAEHFDALLSAVRSLFTCKPSMEVTLEANPGAIEHDRFAAYREAGVNRFSIGVQSFSDSMLGAIGRIHGRGEALAAIEALHAADIENFNLDLMFALPGQSIGMAEDDVRTAIACGPAHISHYQLTIEPNTAFHAAPPSLPDDETAWRMQERGSGLLGRAGYRQYEISAWARNGQECRHNLNYWRYGDYLGFGAGAHGKITLPDGAIRRRVRVRHPEHWMKAVAGGHALAEDRLLVPDERVFEYFLNQLRLREGLDPTEFEARTGLSWAVVADRVEELKSRGLLEMHGDRLIATDLGWRFVNEMQALFLP